MKAPSVFRPAVWILAAFVLVAAAFLPAPSASAEADMAFDVRFTGVITTVGTPGASWVVGGQTVNTDARTRIVLTVSPAAAGQWADVMAVRQSDNSLLAREIIVRPEQVQLRGIVSVKPEAADGVGDWVIAGVMVTVTADTKFSTRGGPIDVGQWVEAVMQEADSGLTALRMIGIEPQDAVEVTGAIKSFDAQAWNLSSIVLKLDADTTVAGTPAVGLIAHATANLQDDGSLLAMHLRVAWNDRRAPVQPAVFDGVIEQLPDAGLTGEWIIDGKTVVVLPSTRINQVKGLAVVGAKVHVEGVQAADKVMAAVITVLESSQEGGTFMTITGRINALPASGVIGAWTVADRIVEVNTGTTIRPQNVAPAVGMMAVVQGVRRASDGVTVATDIMVRPGRPQHP